MIIKRIVYVACIILKFVFPIGLELYAQSARIEALGGNFCIDDFSSVGGNPASSVNYTDALQATAYQDTSFGAVIGVKSIGELLAVGFSANMPDDAYSTFYDEACSFADSFTDTLNKLPDTYPPYPHLFAALQLPFMTLGGEIFYKRVSHSSEHENGSDGYRGEKEISTIGGSVNATLNIGKLGIFPGITYSIPHLRGMSEKTGSGPIVSITTVGNRTVSASIELGIYPENMNISVGGAVFNELYTFVCDTFSHGENPHFNTMSIDLYGGFTLHPSDKSLLSALYTYNNGVYRYSAEYNDEQYNSISRESWIENKHTVIGSAEMTQEIASIGLELFFRAGLSWTLSTSESKTDFNDGATRSNTRMLYPDIVTQVIPSIGLGVKKGILQFDIASKIAGWTGIISGMPVVTGTLTFDFKDVANKKRETNASDNIPDLNDY